MREASDTEITSKFSTGYATVEQTQDTVAHSYDIGIERVGEATCYSIVFLRWWTFLLLSIMSSYSLGTYLNKPFSYGIVILSPRDLGLDSVLESADTLTEKVAPAISPVMTTLVSVSAAVTEPLSPPSTCW